MRLLSLVATVACVVCAACSDDASPDDEASTGSVYVAILRHLDVPDPGPDGERAVVYVADMNNDPLSLDGQVEVIGVLDPDVDVRFVDDIDAAVDSDGGAFAAPDGGWLVAVGTPVDDGTGDVIAVRVEVIEPDDEPVAWQLHLDVSADVTVVESVELEPELLVTPVSS